MSTGMKVLEAIAGRRSIRKYKPQPVEQDKLELLLEAARLSPSARNEQNWRFIVVRDNEKKQLLYEAAFEQPQISEAPCVIVACSTDRRIMNCGQPTDTVNLSIAMSYVMLEAYELGLGTCWLGRFDAEKVKKTLNIPTGHNVIAIMPVGYPAERPEPRPRKSLGDIVGYDSF